MINLKNITKKYANLTVFDGFNLSIKRGITTCVLGESGSGKTTLLNIIANLTPFDGQVDGVSVSYAFQKPNLVKSLTALQNLTLVGCSGIDAIKILKAVNLEDKVNAYPNHLSGGQAQRVSLARALIKEADVLLMDEPFSSLDVKTKTELIARINALITQKNRTVLFVTHDVDEALAMADEIIVLKNNDASFSIKIETDKLKRSLGDDDKNRKIILDYLKK